MAERPEENFKENLIEVDGAQKRAEQDAIKSAAHKETSRTELGVDGPLQEEPKEDAIRGNAGRSRKWKYITAFLLLLCLAIVVSGGLLMRTQYCSSPRTDSAATQEYLYGLKPFFVPLSKPESKKFLRMTIALELSGKNAPKQIATHAEEVRTSILKTLVSIPPRDMEIKQVEDLLSEQIISAINLLIEGNIVKGVIFNDLQVV